MNPIKHIIEWVREFLESDVGIVLAFSFLLAELIGFVLIIVKKIKLHANTILGLLLIATIILFGLTFPILILVSSSWNGFGRILLNLLAAFAIISFLGLLYIIKAMNAVVISSKLLMEQATIRARTTHTFFNGEIFIYMVAENFGGRPIDHRITARVWSTNYSEEV